MGLSITIRDTVIKTVRKNIIIGLLLLKKSFLGETQKPLNLIIDITYEKRTELTIFYKPHPYIRTYVS